MKKEYHLTVSRKDRIYLCIFMVFLLGWELSKPLFIKKEIAPHDDAIIREKSITADTLLNKDEDQKHHPRAKKNAAFSMKDERTTPLHSSLPPVPLTLDTAEFQDLVGIGFSKIAAINLVKYRNAGGNFYSEKQVLKLYGMDSVQWADAKAYVIFPEKISPSKTAEARSRPPIDLNMATIHDLDSLPGIGLVLAERITKFRDAIGGFHSLAQLSEVYGLPPETIQKITPRLTIQTPHQKWNLTSSRLLDHPYLDPKVKRILTAYTKQHGAPASAEELRKVFPPDPGWFQKLLPYIEMDSAVVR